MPPSIPSSPRPSVRGVASIEPFRDGGVRYWDVTFENEGDQPFVGTIAFSRSQKNEGEGFESMAAPAKGWKVIQRICEQRDHGVRPAPGELLRLQVRGLSFLELPLPDEREVRVPLDDFQPMEHGRVEHEYLDPNYVQRKVWEKSEVCYRDGTLKMAFLKDDKQVYHFEP